MKQILEIWLGKTPPPQALAFLGQAHQISFAHTDVIFDFYILCIAPSHSHLSNGLIWGRESLQSLLEQAWPMIGLFPFNPVPVPHSRTQPSWGNEAPHPGSQEPPPVTCSGRRRPSGSPAFYDTRWSKSHVGRLPSVWPTPGKWPIQSLNQEAIRRELKLFLVPLGTREGMGTCCLSALSWEEACREFTPLNRQHPPPPLPCPPSLPQPTSSGAALASSLGLSLCTQLTEGPSLGHSDTTWKALTLSVPSALLEAPFPAEAQPAGAVSRTAPRLFFCGLSVLKL